MPCKLHKVQCRTDKFHLKLGGYKEQIERELAVKLIHSIPHEDLVKLFNIEWFETVAENDVEARGSIRYKLPATIEGEPPTNEENYTEDDYV